MGRHMYVTFGQKPAWEGPYARLLAKNLRGKKDFSLKSTCIRDFWPKTCVYREGSGKKQAKDQTNKGECQWMNML